MPLAAKTFSDLICPRPMERSHLLHHLQHWWYALKEICLISYYYVLGL